MLGSSTSSTTKLSVFLKDKYERGNSFRLYLALVNVTINKPQTKEKWLFTGNKGPVTQASRSTLASRNPLNAQKRPSAGEVSPPHGISAKRSSVRPPPDVPKDMIAHFHVKTKRWRCRPFVKKYANTLCRKCNVHFCFANKRDCL